MMLVRMKRILKASALLAFVLLISLQVLNVRSPITIEKAQATETESGVCRVSGHTNVSYCSIKLTKPDGTNMYTQSDYWGNFSFVGDEVSDFPDGTYTLRSSKSCYSTVSKTFTLNVEMGARAEVTMVKIWNGPSYMAIYQYFPWY